MISLVVLKKCAGLIAVVAAGLLMLAPAADAQTYSLYADCSRADGWSARGDGNYAAYQSCQGGWLAGMRTLVSPHNDGRVAAGTGMWTFMAPTGTKVVGLQWQGNKYYGVSSAGWIGGGWAMRTGMFGDGYREIDDLADCYTHNLGACYSGAASNPNARSVPSHHVGNLNDGIVGFYTQCVPSPNSCPANSDGLAGHNFVRAGLVVSDMRVDLRDDYDPTVSPLVKVTPATNGWHKGSVTVRFDARDNSGIRQTAVREGTVNRVVRARTCDWWRLKPCADHTGAEGDHVIDTTELADGRHPLVPVAWDAAARTKVGAAHDLYVDNTEPPKPPALSVDGGDGWSSDPSRTLRWTLPSQGAGSPVNRVYVQTCKVGGSCVEAPMDPTTVWGGLAPTAGPGEYAVRVAAGDSAGKGAWSDPVTFRFDNVAPGAAEPAKSNGWLNAVERAGYQQSVKLENDALKPASGIGGYSITTDGSDPDATIEAPGEAVEYPIGDLPEGVNVIKVRTVSGAGIGGSDVRTAEVRVDLSKPSAAAPDAPDSSRWHKQGVSFPLKGLDQPDLSGMAPGSETRPVEEGAYIAYRIDGGDLHKVRGDSAPVTVADEGEHVISYYAVDVAGNESETQTVQFKIDRTSPVANATSDAVSPSVWQREAVTATLTGDDGNGRSGMDPAVEDRPVEEGGHLVYRLNAGPVRKGRGASATFKVDDDGDHTVEYYAIDGAGNESEHKTLRFRIDRTAPLPVVLEDPGGDRRRIEVDASDAMSGVGEVQIGLRRVASGSALAATRRFARRAPRRYRRTKLRGTRQLVRRVPSCRKKRRTAKRRCLVKRRKQLKHQRIAPLGPSWRMLPAAREGNRWVAYVPTDQSLARGVYQLQAVAQDAAGNEGAADKFRSGAPAVIDPCLVAQACQPGSGSPGSGGGGSPSGGGGGTGPGRAPLNLGPDGGTVATKVAAGSVRKVRVKKRLPRKCKRPRSTKLKKRCAKLRKPRYKRVFTRSLRVKHGKKATIAGTLTTVAGAPIAGGTLDVITTANAAGHSPRVVAAVRSSASGAFVYRAPAGTSRKVTFRFRGLAQYRRSSADVDVLVPAAATLKSSKRQVANGQSVVFRGKLLSRPLPTRGKVVDLQVFYRGKWRTFGTPRAGRSGRFKFRYRFEATRRTTTYKFRARLRAESAYPYELGYSKTVRVRVRGG